MNPSPQVSASAAGGAFTVSVGGEWSIETPWPQAAESALGRLADSGVGALILKSDNLGKWDSSLLVFLVQLVDRARKLKMKVELDLPEGIDRLIRMAFAVPPRKGAQRNAADTGFLEKVGQDTLSLWPRVADFLGFLGDVSIGMGRLLVGRSKMRVKDLFVAMYECGVLSLPIISLTSMLFGLILAFVGAVQLTQFGAQIYVAGLVGIGMLRVMGAVMVGQRPGSCGQVVDRMTIKCDSPDPANVPGVLYVKGRNVMQGYFKNPEATAEVLAPDGWMSTGDIGNIDAEGYIYIRGRDKNMILGPSGQNIYPEEIEQKHNNMPYVAESVVVENGAGKLVALVYPDLENVNLQKIPHEQLQTLMESNIKTLNQELPGYSQITGVKIMNEEFEKTPKRSIKRYIYMHQA